MAALFPNQFVNVSMLVTTLRQVPTVPVSALRHGAPGDFVFVVQPGGDTVKLVVVKTGPSDGTRTAILPGLNKGDKVVSEGLTVWTTDRRSAWAKRATGGEKANAAADAATPRRRRQPRAGWSGHKKGGTRQAATAPGAKARAGREAPCPVWHRAAWFNSASAMILCPAACPRGRAFSGPVLTGAIMSNPPENPTTDGPGNPGDTM
jgi:hypothetical protein